MDALAAETPSPSTLAPPPLETAATGTRTVQRFDLGRMIPPRAPRSEAADETDTTDAALEALEMSSEQESSDVATADAPETGDDPEIRVIVGTVQLPVPESVRHLPVPEPSAARAFAATPWAPKPARPSSPAVLREAAWALAAGLASCAMGSAASALVYLLFFP